jgi:predicted RecA/RadA family phage recombinase
MARDAVAYVSLVNDNVTDIPAGTAVNTTNGAIIAVPRVTTPGAADSIDRMLLYVTNTAGSDKTVTVKAGVGTTASARGGTGDLAVTCKTATGGCLIGPLDSNRFAQADGSVWVDYASGLTGALTAFMLPSRR